MTDKQWLDRVVTGFLVYEKNIDDVEKQKVDQFIAWLHQQYGIIYSSSNKNTQSKF